MRQRSDDVSTGQAEQNLRLRFVLWLVGFGRSRFNRTDIQTLSGFEQSRRATRLGFAKLGMRSWSQCVLHVFAVDASPINQRVRNGIVVRLAWFERVGASPSAEGALRFIDEILVAAVCQFDTRRRKRDRQGGTLPGNIRQSELSQAKIDVGDDRLRCRALSGPAFPGFFELLEQRVLVNCGVRRCVSFSKFSAHINDGLTVPFQLQGAGFVRNSFE